MVGSKCLGACRPHRWAGCSATSTLVKQPGDKPGKNKQQLLKITLNGAVDEELIRGFLLWTNCTLACVRKALSQIKNILVEAS